MQRLRSGEATDSASLSDCKMMHVLLVEDSPTDVFMIREAMRRSPIPADVAIAYDGERALQVLTALGRSRFDLVILDLNLPKVDGYQILQAYPVADGPPVVVFSGSESPSDKERAFELCAKDYVVKPAAFEAFILAVQGILQRWCTDPPSMAV
jgi:DNA-binding response OmpR family regulator